MRARVRLIIRPGLGCDVQPGVNSDISAVLLQASSMRSRRAYAELTTVASRIYETHKFLSVVGAANKARRALDGEDDGVLADGDVAAAAGDKRAVQQPHVADGDAQLELTDQRALVRLDCALTAVRGDAQPPQLPDVPGQRQRECPGLLDSGAQVTAYVGSCHVRDW